MLRQFSERSVIDAATKRHGCVVIGLPRRCPFRESRIVMHDRPQLQAADVIFHVPNGHGVGAIIDRVPHRLRAVILFNKRFRERTVEQALRAHLIAGVIADRFAA